MGLRVARPDTNPEYGFGLETTGATTDLGFGNSKGTGLMKSLASPIVKWLALFYCTIYLRSAKVYLSAFPVATCC